jgi:hypothetical protein
MNIVTIVYGILKDEIFDDFYYSDKISDFWHLVLTLNYSKPAYLNSVSFSKTKLLLVLENFPTFGLFEICESFVVCDKIKYTQKLKNLPDTVDFYTMYGSLLEYPSAGDRWIKNSTCVNYNIITNDKYMELFPEIEPESELHLLTITCNKLTTNRLKEFEIIGASFDKFFRDLGLGSVEIDYEKR